MYLLVPYFTFYVLNNTFPHTKKGTKNCHISCQLSETETQTADDDTHTQYLEQMHRRKLFF